MEIHTSLTDTKEFKPQRLTKQNLADYLAHYASLLYSPEQGTPEERQAGYLTQWTSENEQMKKDGKNKKMRRNRRKALKAKWGLKTSYKTKITLGRLSLIRSIQNTFDLPEAKP